MDMTWPLAREFALALVRQERDQLMAQAVAARAAQADEKGWGAWVKSLGSVTDR